MGLGCRVGLDIFKSEIVLQRVARSRLARSAVEESVIDQDFAVPRVIENQGFLFSYVGRRRGVDVRGELG